MAEDNTNQQNKKNYFNNSNAAFESMNNMANNIGDFMDFNNIRKQFVKNLETLNDANNAMIEFAKSMSQRTAEFMQNNAKSVMDLAHCTLNSSNMNDACNKQASTTSDLVNQTVSHVNEASDKCANTVKTVANAYGKRASEALSEIHNKSNK